LRFAINKPSSLEIQQVLSGNVDNPNNKSQIANFKQIPITNLLNVKQKIVI